jgi:hypothetical protein
MQTIPRARVPYCSLMAQEGGAGHSGGGAADSSTREVSLADGTGEGNAPIEGTSASSDPEVLAGTTDAAATTSLNDDDYPENIVEAAGAVDDGSDELGPASTSGATTMPDEAAGVDFSTGSATPDTAGKK